MKDQRIATLKINITNSDEEKYIRIEFMALIIYLNFPMIIHRIIWEDETVITVIFYPLIKFVWIKSRRDVIPF